MDLANRLGNSLAKLEKADWLLTTLISNAEEAEHQDLNGMYLLFGVLRELKGELEKAEQLA